MYYHYYYYYYQASRSWRPTPRRAAPTSRARTRATTSVVRDFKDAVHPFFESDTLFLEWFVCIVCIVWRFFESSYDFGSQRKREVLPRGVGTLRYVLPTKCICAVAA